MDMQKKLKTFFYQYAQRFNDSLGDKGKVDVDGQVAAFADCFIEASPLGVNCVQNDAEFRKMIPKGYEHYKSIGTTAMNIGSLDITPLDDYHAMAKVHWESRYHKKDGSDDAIDFDVIYFVQLLNGEPKIFAFITGDEEQTMKDHGLIPDEAAEPAK